LLLEEEASNLVSVSVADLLGGNVNEQEKVSYHGDIKMPVSEG
jgi:hypothetical protein